MSLLKCSYKDPEKYLDTDVTIRNVFLNVFVLSICIYFFLFCPLHVKQWMRNMSEYVHKVVNVMNNTSG